MLVLQRKLFEGLTITDRRTGETIVITVVRNGIYTRLGIEASDDYIILRNELLAEPVSVYTRGSNG